MNSGTYNLTIEQVHKLVSLQVDLDELTREVMFSRCHRICPFKKCERENSEEKLNYAEKSAALRREQQTHDGIICPNCNEVMDKIYASGKRVCVSCTTNGK